MHRRPEPSLHLVNACPRYQCIVNFPCARESSFALAATLSGPHVDTTLGAGPEHLVAHTHDAAVDRARYAVLYLHVELREHEGLVHAGVADITLRRRIHDVANLETFHSLVLRDAAAAVHATDDSGVAAAVLRATVVAALGRHVDTAKVAKVEQQLTIHP